MNKIQLTESIFNMATDRTIWLKQFNNHQDYVNKLNEFKPLYELKQFKGGDWFSINNTQVRLDDNGIILEAIKF